MILYIDGALWVNHDATPELEKLGKYFKMKPGSIGQPDICLERKMA